MKTNGSNGKINGKKANIENIIEIPGIHNLDLDNTVSFIGNTARTTFDLLYKIKVTINLLFNDQAFMELIQQSVANNEIGKRFIIGNSSLHNFVITSVISNNKDEESYVIILKYVHKIHEIQHEPGTINSITLKRFRINKLSWENRADISFINTIGKEYNLKISFFNRN